MEPLTADDPQQMGGFRLRSRLGAGGMGRVYLGFSPAGRAVAVKVVHPAYARDPGFRERFAREVRAAETVSGAFTAPVVAAGPDDDPPWLATAFVPGPSLADVVAEAGPLPAAAIWRLAGGLAEALQAVHARGLVHRDLKPANVLLAADGPRLIDFGISRAQGATALTAAGVAMGTPTFMSPEQVRAQTAGPPSDVFCLGSVLAYAATGRGPFDAEERLAVAYRIVQADPDLDGMSGPLRDLVAGCLAKDPAGRPALAQVLGAVTAQLASPLDAAASFWPEPLAGLIGSRQDRLRAEAGTPSGPGAAAAGTASAEGVSVEGAAVQGAAVEAAAAAPGAWPMKAGPRAGPGRILRDPGLVAMAALAVLGVIALVLLPSPGGSAAPAAASHRATGAATAPSSSALPVAPTGPGPVRTALVCTEPPGGCTSTDPTQMRAKPPMIIITANQLSYIEYFTWSGWGGPVAVGQGTLYYYRCPPTAPDCSTGGSYAQYRAKVTVGGLVPVSRQFSAYSRMTVSAPAAPQTVFTFSRAMIP